MEREFLKSVSEHNGIVVVDKPAGMTSHDVVNRIRKIYKTKRVGHTGTLDPDATGALVLCVGAATRLAEFLSAANKKYVAEFLFGVETTTQDTSGEIIAVQDASQLNENDIQRLLPAFQGTIVQIPPMVSARHHEGKRLYELAREGIIVEREAREIKVSQFEMTSFTQNERPTASFEVICSTGTYIRTLAFDLGRATGVGACMSKLRRVWVGKNEQTVFHVKNAYSLEELHLRSEAQTLQETMIPLPHATASWTQITLGETDIALIRQGRFISLNENFQTDSYPVAVLNEKAELCAVARILEGTLRPTKVLT